MPILCSFKFKFILYFCSRWGSWAGPEENKYSKMKYDNGQVCWNGPTRSVMVCVSSFTVTF